MDTCLVQITQPQPVFVLQEGKKIFRSPSSGFICLLCFTRVPVAFCSQRRAAQRARAPWLLSPNLGFTADLSLLVAKPFHPVPSQHAQESCVHPELGNPWICANNLRKGWIFQDAISSSQGQLSGARAAEMLPAGDWSDHVMLVLFGARI